MALFESITDFLILTRCYGDRKCYGKVKRAAEAAAKAAAEAEARAPSDQM